ncbi:MAG TPA: FAD-dependent oxidoreductase, partial [Gaiellaceae bacterium]|nr:FAD-dependent oxidoreductase [Gaiellaceae bacterium]
GARVFTRIWLALFGLWPWEEIPQIPPELLWSRVSREPAATFAARPGTAGLRAGPETGRANVARAGAWTATGWPATMESAIRSGLTAARYLQSAVREKVTA